jgi:DNA sulfur modification protein DndD
LWKNEQFKEVSLDENFNLEVLDRYDKPALQDLSSGERQVLSLSFIVAMSRLSREEAPLMMDTPFGRLSAENRVNITEHVPELADQLILLVTDEELHGQARANLEPHIGREYNLRFDLQSGCTIIEEVL